MAKKLNINSFQERKATSYCHAPVRATIYFLIVSEGKKSEPNYFKTFIGNRGSKIVSVTCGKGGKNTTQLIKEARKLIEIDKKKGVEYDSVWIVFDKDQFPDEAFNAAVNDAPKQGIHVAWSNPSFEFWYLLHLADISRELTPAGCIQEIEKIINAKTSQKSKKAFKYNKATNDFSWLDREQNETLAISRAEKLVLNMSNQNYAKTNPCTTVYKLVRQLSGKDEEFNKSMTERICK